MMSSGAVREEHASASMICCSQMTMHAFAALWQDRCLPVLQMRVLYRDVAPGEPALLVLGRVVHVFMTAVVRGRPNALPSTFLSHDTATVTLMLWHGVGEQIQ